MSEELFISVGGPKEILVPKGFDARATIQKLFNKEALSTNFKSALSQVDYPEPHSRFVPGARFRVRVVGVAKHATMTIAGCVEYLDRQDSILLGLEGLLLTYVQHRALFTLPEGPKPSLHHLSFIAPLSKEAAYKERLEHREGKLTPRTPYITVNRDGTASAGHAVYRKIGEHGRLLRFTPL